jgi:hypothetical protein
MPRGHRPPFTMAPVADSQSGDGCGPQGPIWGFSSCDGRSVRPDSGHVCIGGHCHHARGGWALSRDKARATGNLRPAGIDSNIIDPVALGCLHATGGNAADRIFRRKAKSPHRRGLDALGRRAGSPAGDRVGRDWRANQRRRHIARTAHYDSALAHGGAATMAGRMTYRRATTIGYGSPECHAESASRLRNITRRSAFLRDEALFFSTSATVTA